MHIFPCALGPRKGGHGAAAPVEHHRERGYERVQPGDVHAGLQAGQEERQDPPLHRGPL